MAGQKWEQRKRHTRDHHYFDTVKFIFMFAVFEDNDDKNNNLSLGFRNTYRVPSALQLP